MQTTQEQCKDELKPNFDLSKLSIEADEIKNEAEKHVKSLEPDLHKEILPILLEQLETINFKEEAGFTREDEKLTKKHYLICSIEYILKIAKKNNWALCIYQAFIYLYNGAYWGALDTPTLKTFLGEAAEKIGVYKFDARHYCFREELVKQFHVAANLPKPEQPKNTVLMNFKNGTLEISPDKQELRLPSQNDFITYQLPFEYNLDAKAPIFEFYLNRVLPNKGLQLILAEYLGYLFIKSETLKLEKALILYGSGANGKSVIFEIIYALLGGDKNVSNYSLQNLTNETGYARAMLANKLVNYATEINGKLDTSIFKQLVSGEPVEARLPYGEPFSIANYAKLIFNCNELPKEVEHTYAYFRRFLIIPFNITIPPEEQDKELSKRIIQSELSGIFNWVLEGLKRLLKQRNFTQNEEVDKQIEQYKKQSDSISLFLEEENYVKDPISEISLKELYWEYRNYCIESDNRPCSKKTFSERLKNNGFEMDRKNYGNVVFMKRENVL